MGDLLTTLDVVIFFASLAAVMGVGLWAGRKEDTSADYYLAGRQTRWWGVAGSIFGSNVSANHVVGMMGVGFSIGFAQSHFEIGAIAGLLLLCYGFLPVYRKLNLYTLSEYLGRRYDDRSRIVYAVIMLAIMVIIGMVAGFYIGSRSLIMLLQGGPGHVDPTWYKVGIALMAVVTGTYTILGGLKAVIVTDVIQSVLLLLAGIVVALLVFCQPEIGGWAAMAARDAAPGGADKLHLYQPIDHPKLPWTGMLTGVMVLHVYYWGANQFIVQRALSARSDRDARLGIVAAGFLKLTIPFFAIGTGIAAFYLFQDRKMDVAQDAVFATLLTELIAPIGYGALGLVAAGMIGAILSSIDSMMNSSATILTFDVYQRFVNPAASEKQLVWFGRMCVVVLIVASALLTMFTMDPNSKDSFFLHIARHQTRLIAGVVVAFALGMLWRRSTATAGVVTIVAGVLLSYGLPPLYAKYLGTNQSIAAVLGTQLNVFHAVPVAAAICAVLHVIVSLLGRPDEEKSKLTWVGQGIIRPSALRAFLAGVGMSVIVFAVLALSIVYGGLLPSGAAWIAAIWTWAAFAVAATRRVNSGERRPLMRLSMLADDRFWAGLLAACAVFMMFYFF